MKNWVFLGSLCVRQWHIRTTPGLLESLPSSFEAYNCEKRGEQFSQVSKREKNRNTQTTQHVALINYDDCIFEFLTTPNKGIIIVYLHFPNEAKYCTSTKKGFLFLQGASAKCKHSCLLNDYCLSGFPSRTTRNQGLTPSLCWKMISISKYVNQIWKLSKL